MKKMTIRKRVLVTSFLEMLDLQEGVSLGEPREGVDLHHVEDVVLHLVENVGGDGGREWLGQARPQRLADVNLQRCLGGDVGVVDFLAADDPLGVIRAAESLDVEPEQQVLDVVLALAVVLERLQEDLVLQVF